VVAPDECYAKEVMMKTTQAELPGYAEYTRRTRYRLLPGVW